MACYMDEEEIWKCPTHPSKRRRTGICPTCLRGRLVTLCPDCANVRPCACCPSSTSSSSSSSFSLFSSSSASGVDGEPSFRRSRSVAIPFLRSRSRYTGNTEFSEQKPPAAANRSKRSLLSIFKTNKSKKEVERESEELTKTTSNDNARTTMIRSRSVSVAISSISGDGHGIASSKGRGWYFPSPLKAFRQSKTSKVVQERSPMCRS